MEAKVYSKIFETNVIFKPLYNFLLKEDMKGTLKEVCPIYDIVQSLMIENTKFPIPKTPFQHNIVGLNIQKKQKDTNIRYETQ